MKAFLNKSLYYYNFNLEYYNNWLNIYEDNKNSLNRDILLEKVSNIISNIKKNELYSNIKELYKNITDTNMLSYICKNCELLSIKLQLNILTKIKKSLKSIKNDDEILGNIKYYIKKPFNHDNKSKLCNILKLFEIITDKIIDEEQFVVINKMIDYNIYFINITVL